MTTPNNESRLSWLLAVIAIISLGVAIYANPPAPRAVGLLQMHAITPSILGTTEYDPDEYKRFRATEIKLIKSPVILSRVLSDPDVASLGTLQGQEDPMEYLRNHLHVNWTDDDEIVEVVFADHVANPKDLSTVVNEILRAYLRKQTREAKQRTVLLIDVLEKERLIRSAKVEQLRKRVYDLRKQVKEDPEPSPQSAQLGYAEAELARAEEVFEMIARRKLHLQIEQEAPSRVSLLQIASVPVN